MRGIRIKFTDEVAVVDDEDWQKLSEMGEWLLQINGYRKYAYLEKTQDKKLFMHNIVMAPTEETEIDHINGIGLDNQKKNLRLATRQQNSLNRGVNKNSTTGCKGVSWMERLKKYRAYIVKDGRQENIGYFRKLQDASDAYDKRAVELFGEFAKTNKSING